MIFSDKFISCQKLVGVAEGGWACNKNDNGKETLFGVSRRWNPTWAGWLIVDQYASRYGRGTPAFIQAVNNDQNLKDNAYNLFYNNYYLLISGDDLPLNCAKIVYDMCINSGPGEACELLGRCLNQAGCNQIAAHKMMPLQIQFLNSMFTTSKGLGFCKQLLLARKAFYQEDVNNDPSQKVNWHSWMQRLRLLAQDILGNPMEGIFV